MVSTGKDKNATETSKVETATRAPGEARRSDGPDRTEAQRRPDDYPVTGIDEDAVLSGQAPYPGQRTEFATNEERDAAIEHARNRDVRLLEEEPRDQAREHADHVRMTMGDDAPASA